MCHSASQDVLYTTDWDDDKTRRHFISKVCSILALQLAFTTAIVAVALFVEDVADFLRENKYLYYVALGTSFFIMLKLLCYTECARSYPINYILLSIFTFMKSICCSYFTILFTTDKVFQALGVTVAVCVGLAMFAIFAPCDFTGWGTYLFVLSIVGLIMVVWIMLTNSKVILWIYSCFGLVLFSCFLVYDIQLMVGGKYQWNEKDYVVAALCIYIDIVRMFRHILFSLDLWSSDD